MVWRVMVALIIALALLALWAYGINRMLLFGFVPPVPGWWPVELGPFNPKMAYYLAVVVVWLGLTAVGLRVILKLTRREATPQK